MIQILNLYKRNFTNYERKVGSLKCVKNIKVQLLHSSSFMRFKTIYIFQNYTFDLF